MPVTRSRMLQAFMKLGLTAQEAEAYQLLNNHQSMTVQALAKNLGISANGLYRILKQLENKGLVLSRETHPTSYWAVPPKIGLEKWLLTEKSRLDEAKETVVRQLENQKQPMADTAVESILGKEAFFQSYIGLAKRARHEILVISIGEPVSDEVLIANRDAVERGVHIKLIFHKYDETNAGMLQRYLKMGWDVRHYPGWGFHLVIVDGKNALLGVNNPNATDERVGMLMQSEGMAKAMRDYFYSVWDKALMIRI